MRVKPSINVAFPSIHADSLHELIKQMDASFIVDVNMHVHVRTHIIPVDLLRFNINLCKLS